jgi:hypothetical protein
VGKRANLDVGFGKGKDLGGLVAHELCDVNLAVVHLRLGLQVEHAQACRINKSTKYFKGLTITSAKKINESTSHVVIFSGKDLFGLGQVVNHHEASRERHLGNSG